MGSTYAVWGWGGPESEPTREGLESLALGVQAVTGVEPQAPETPAPLPVLPAPRVALPGSLTGLASAAPLDRAAHAGGWSYRDVVRGVRGQLDSVPDLVVRPGSESEVAAVLDWAGDAAVAVVPYGGGTSVVGGVEPDVGARFAGSVSLDLGRLRGVAEIDAVSRAARVRAGTPGPELEDGLRDAGLTARFYPQSFERSTLGGWVATRAAGHFSTRAVHIDDLVESVRAVTPIGVWESRRLPGSGAGVSPDRMLLGSEGTLGVVTEAWLRVQPRPTGRWAATLAAPDLLTGAAAVRALLHAGLLPATARVVDADEARFTGMLPTGETAVVLGLESLDGPLDASAEQVLTLCRDVGLRVVEAGERGPAGTSWRSTFLRAPYLREQAMLLGVLMETFETAITWDRLGDLVRSVTEAVTAALRRVCGGGTVTCRTTHAYPDGIAPYFTVIAPARRGSELAQWDEVKAAASEALLAAGGTITHHHAVGRDHRQWYDAQRPEPFARALAGAKSALDPAGVLNPGVLLGP
jgi:alkyldihydroxyacetonephosphate synthase